MTTALTSRKASTKVVRILARYQLKASGHVVYAVRPSKGGDPYYTTIVNGKASGCTCPAMKPCYHMLQLEERETGRIVNQVEAMLNASDEVDEDEAYEAWKHDHGYDEPMTREDYAAFFDPNGWGL